MEKADLAVIIGRFQGPHLSHQKIFKAAHDYARHVVVLVGSANSSRTIKNPFTFEERKQMILSSLGVDLGRNTTVLPLRDYHYSDDLWVAQVQEKVSQVLAQIETASSEPEVILVGNFSDKSSYYLQYFPQWPMTPVSGINDIHATAIRNMIFAEGISDPMKPLRFLPKEIHSFIKSFMKTEKCEELRKELTYIHKYKESWKAAPFPVTFVTTDAVVTCMGHILVVKRKVEPGKGLMALPGGFLKQDERLEDGALRELKEETGIRVDKSVLRRSIVNSRVFDYPGRSLRGRTITHAYHIKLDNKSLPEIKAGDDADKVMWLPFADVYKLENEFFEDHAHIIQAFITQG